MKKQISITSLFYKRFKVQEEEMPGKDYFIVDPKPLKIAEFIESEVNKAYHKGFYEGLNKKDKQ